MLGVARGRLVDTERPPGETLGLAIGRLEGVEMTVPTETPRVA
jgi:hypothetical protein